MNGHESSIALGNDGFFLIYGRPVGVVTSGFFIFSHSSSGAGVVTSDFFIFSRSSSGAGEGLLIYGLAITVGFTGILAYLKLTSDSDVSFSLYIVASDSSSSSIPSDSRSISDEEGAIESSSSLSLSSNLEMNLNSCSFVWTFSRFLKRSCLSFLFSFMPASTCFSASVLSSRVVVLLSRAVQTRSV